jgi:hypothetical protein
VRIANWPTASSAVTPAQSETEYAYNTDVSSTATVTNSGFANGTDGVVFSANWSTGTTWVRRVRFNRNILVTDQFEVEVKSPASTNWTPINAQVSPGYSEGGGSVFGWTFNPINATDGEVVFRAGGYTYGATFGAVGPAWSSLNASGWRWRVRKSPAGPAQPVFVQSPVRAAQTGVAPNAGEVGEQQRAIQTTFTNCAASGQYSDIASITLTAGVWDISSLAQYSINGATVTVVSSGIGTAPGNLSTGLVGGDNSTDGPPPTSAYTTSISIPQYRVSPTTSTTYYLKSLCVFSAGSPQARGRISAVRIGDR